ncbi:MAG TPA: class I SAM-dependent methyltransferase [Trebonia sp.]|nr:class I SAM-dependent methyltransferase [Trebonia sp.]
MTSTKQKPAGPRDGFRGRSRQHGAVLESDSKDTDRESRERFDRWAPRYDRSAQQWFFFGPAHAAALQTASAAGMTPEDVLDVGCGTGRLLERAAQQWPKAHLLGIDAAPLMIAEAKKKHGGDARFRFEVADAVALPLGASAVDLAFSTFSHHHWSDQQAGVREIARVLRPGGVFILAHVRPSLLPGPNADSRQGLFENAGLNVIGQHRPLRLAGAVLLTAGRKR